MIYIYHGDDFILSLESVFKKIKEINSKNQYDYISYDGEKISYADIEKEIESISMFSTKKIILIKRFLNSSENLTKLELNMPKFLKTENIIFFWESREIDSKNLKKIQNALKSSTNNINLFKKPTESSLIKWIISEFNSQNIKINPDLSTLFIKNIGTEYPTIVYSEVKKVIHYCSVSNLKLLKKEIIESLISDQYEGNVWRFLEYFGQRQKKEVFQEAKRLIQNNQSMLLITMISREIHLYSQIKYCIENKIDLNKLDIPKFKINEMAKFSKNFTWNELYILTKKLLELDISIKKGKIDEHTGICLYLSLL